MRVSPLFERDLNVPEDRHMHREKDRREEEEWQRDEGRVWRDPNGKRDQIGRREEGKQPKS